MRLRQEFCSKQDDKRLAHTCWNDKQLISLAHHDMADYSRHELTVLVVVILASSVF